MPHLSLSEGLVGLEDSAHPTIDDVSAADLLILETG
jgi:hypothetical protein